ncbi:hypothetical protein CPB84DRAFT_1736988 [Gymnopilus junonius]|uniref:Uncharacterized protein n=1 Tax=Gymnopilus junonius TaxID=109634 RepID=A0A9P5N8J6_GYMJU|nr:hypothetical protein CPB84DRAFT_1736988 [Gymnopilus junonius]
MYLLYSEKLKYLSVEFVVPSCLLFFFYARYAYFDTLSPHYPKLSDHPEILSMTVPFLGCPSRMWTLRREARRRVIKRRGEEVSLRGWVEGGAVDAVGLRAGKWD